MLDENFENKILTESQDMDLNKEIHEFWNWVVTSLPSKMHLLRAPIPRTVLKAFEKVDREEEAIERAEAKKE